MTTSIGPATGTTFQTDLLWSTRLGRAFAWLMLISVGAFTLLLKYGGVRELSAVSGPPPLAAIWGWTPSYLTAFALPFMWPALGRRVLKRKARVEFLPEVATGGGIVLFLEILDGVGVHGTFAVSDLWAAVAGALSAFLLHRLLLPRPPAARPE